MNAFNTVNLAAACILTSTNLAKQIGIPESKWIYPIGGAGTKDSEDCMSSFETQKSRVRDPSADTFTVWERPNFYSSPSISRSIDSSLRVSGISKEEVDLYDFYSYDEMTSSLKSPC